MNKLQKLINTLFHNEEYDGTKGPGIILILIAIPPFVVKTLVSMFFPVKADAVEWVFVISTIVLAVAVIVNWITNIISSI